MHCLKGYCQGTINDCMLCDKLTECFDIDREKVSFSNDPRAVAIVYKELGFEPHFSTQIGWISDNFEKITVMSFGEPDRYIYSFVPLEEKDFEDFMMSRQDGLENKLEDFLRDLTLGDYKEHDICLVRAAIEEIESVLDRHGIKYCDPYITTGPYNAENKAYIPEHPCFKECVGPCNKEMCPFGKEEPIL